MKPFCAKWSLILLVVLAQLLGPSVTFAQGYWQVSTLPTGGQVFSLLVTRNGTTYCGTLEGLFSFDTSSVSWNVVVRGCWGWNLVEKQDSTIYVGGYGTIYNINPENPSLYDTLWPGGNGSHTMVVYDIVLDKSGDLWAAAFDSGVVVRTSSGWQKRNDGLAGLNILELFLTSNGTALAGAQGTGVYRSTNNGSSWENVLRSAGNNYAFAQDSSGNVYASAGGNVYCSTDDGASWTTALQNIGDLHVIQCAPDSSIYLGAFDGIKKWLPGTDSVSTQLAGEEIHDISFSSSVGWLAAAVNGVYVSHDSGMSWHQMNTGLFNVLVEDIRQLNQDTLICGSANDGGYRSTDGGKTWSKITDPNLPSMINALTTDNEGDVFAAGGGISRSEDYGLTWQKVFSGVWNVWGMSKLPSDTIWAAYGAGLLKSTDRGSTWVVDSGVPDSIWFMDVQRDSLGDMVAIGANDQGYVYIRPADSSIWSVKAHFRLLQRIAFGDSGQIYIGTNGFYESTDLGQTWTLTGGPGIFSFCVKGGTLYASNGWGAYQYSQSNGWQPMTISTDPITVVGSLSNGSLFAADSKARVYLEDLNYKPPLPVVSVFGLPSTFSVPAGKSQSQIIKIADESVTPLIINSMKTLTKYFSFRAAWPDTIKQSDTASIRITFAPDTVKTYEDTLFIYTNASPSPTKIALTGVGSSPTGIMKEGDGIPTVYELYQNFPNPFNPSTTIKFALPTQSQVSVTIYDILGREVKELVNDKLQAGYYHFTWDASRYSSGVYFYRIEAQSLAGNRKSFVKVKKLLLLK